MTSKEASSELPDFHDGFLTAIVISDNAVDLQCSSVSGETYKLVLFGLRRLRADNFLQGNVIFEINLHHNDVPIDLVKRAFGEENRVEEPVWLQAELARFRENNALLLELTSSYGCELLAIFEGGYRIEKIEQ